MASRDNYDNILNWMFYQGTSSCGAHAQADVDQKVYMKIFDMRIN